jgi:hypothetical protein
VPLRWRTNVKQVIETTDFLTKVMGTPNKIAQTLRDTVIPMVSRLAPFQHAFVQRLSDLGIAYPGSPIVEGPGKRYLDDSMRGVENIRSRVLPVLGNDTQSSTAEAGRELATSFAEIVELRLGQHRGITLVRADGYTAYSADRRDGMAAFGSVRSFLQRQSN